MSRVSRPLTSLIVNVVYGWLLIYFKRLNVFRTKKPALDLGRTEWDQGPRPHTNTYFPV